MLWRWRESAKIKLARWVRGRNPRPSGVIMKSNRKKPEPPQFLSGWKEIANYLGKGVRMVQRYEWQMGLPVRRPAGKPRGSVVATKPELDAWIGASPIREAFHLTRLAPDPEASTKAIKS